jgi:starch synthase
MFKDAKTVFTVYNNRFEHQFDASLPGKVKMIDIEDNDLEQLEPFDYTGLIKIAAQYSDTIVTVNPDIEKTLEEILTPHKANKKIETIEEDAESFSESYFNLYNALVN